MKTNELTFLLSYLLKFRTSSPEYLPIIPEISPFESGNILMSLAIQEMFDFVKEISSATKDKPPKSILLESEFNKIKISLTSTSFT